MEGKGLTIINKKILSSVAAIAPKYHFMHANDIHDGGFNQYPRKWRVAGPSIAIEFLHTFVKISYKNMSDNLIFFMIQTISIPAVINQSLLW